MESHEVIREVLKKTSAKQIASDLQLSLSLIYKWAELPEGDAAGANNPLDRVGQLIRSTKDVRIAQWVAEQAGGFYIRNPENLPPNQPLVPLTNGIVQEFADMLATIAISSSDSVITKDEAKNPGSLGGIEECDGGLRARGRRGDVHAGEARGEKVARACCARWVTGWRRSDDGWDSGAWKTQSPQDRRGRGPVGRAPSR